LENGHTLFDYNVGLNCLIQVMVMPEGFTPSLSTNNNENEIKTDLDKKEALTAIIDHDNTDKTETSDDVIETKVSN